ncbi:uncharacterized protein LOC113098285 [Carassius auratus]|uniref:Uncharacterized protein LOC113098285 n=1 Tax=Carassius auratus TaxID=7957 RepID=A0A6P6PCS2_CARAU|nr:uncharacterized protein LOC113098285 [Carassius auratus]
MAEGQTDLVDLKGTAEDVHSVSTRSSKTSRRSSRASSCHSSASIAVFKARAKAEAAQARAAYAKKEIELKVEQARLQATLEALQEEKEKDAALAEAQVLEEAFLETERSAASRVSVPVPIEDSRNRTANYVKIQSEISSGTLPSSGEKETQPKLQSSQFVSPIKSETDFKDLPISSQNMDFSVDMFQDATQTQASPRRYQIQSGPSDKGDSLSITYDLAKYLARTQLVSAGLTYFDDKPINYWAWKSSFQGAISGLGLSPAEELDLLIKYLGKESSEHARRLKAVNIRSPAAALIMTWQRLEEIYGSPEAIELALFAKLENFPRVTNKDPQKLRDLGDILSELEAAKLEGYLPGLAYLDTSKGVNPIVEKLPYNIQEKWMLFGSKYKQEHRVAFPPFSVFANFVRSEAKARTDPSFSTFPHAKYEKGERFEKQRQIPISVHKTQVSTSTKVQSEQKKRSVSPNQICPMHGKPHPLRRCRGFREKSLQERMQFLKEQSVCYRCCSSTGHIAKNCTVEIQCKECGSDHHLSALHPGPAPWKSQAFTPTSEHGGERDQSDSHEVTSECTEVCGEGLSARSCSKICLVSVYPAGHQEKAKRMYAILDEQSNRSLVRKDFFDIFNIKTSPLPYTLKTCAGLLETAGRRISDFIVESIDGKISLPLPSLLECNQIPNNRTEIPTPDAAFHHSHLRHIAQEIPPLDSDAEILLLLGRDILQVHKVRQQINGPNNAPFAQKLDFGWVVVGDVCLKGAHRPPSVLTFKTFILESGRHSFLSPCYSQIKVKEKLDVNPQRQQSLEASLKDPFLFVSDGENIGCSVFSYTANDHKIAPSVEDTRFLQIMDKEVFQDSCNSWVAPLPFREPRQSLPNNKDNALKRLLALRHTLNKRPQMKAHFLEFMDNLLKNEHAEIAPPLKHGHEVWYLPLFGVYHPKKPNKIRVVFDSSAPFEGVSLNSVLLTGPDLNNSLLGVLMRFRKEPVAITADIQHMFHCFLVREDHKDYLRFLWYRNNDLNSEIVDHRMRVHVFGNSPSPAVAIYGLRRAAKEYEESFGSDTRKLVEKEFYVDDMLKSCATEAEAIDLLKRTQEMLAVSNLRLHKIISNCPSVIEAFPSEDRADGIKDLQLFSNGLPILRSLGVSWNVATDTFVFHVSDDDKPFTRRGVLSTVNGLYDPLGFLAPVTIQGRLLLRELTKQGKSWDSPLPEDMEAEWRKWKNSLQDLKELQIPRVCTSIPLSDVQSKELCVFADASVKAIAAVGYLKVTDHHGHTDVNFLFGKSKLAPQPDITVPRLELCAAVLAVEIAELIVEEMDITFDHIWYYTDSKVVLGYICNQTRRFYVYVNNRVQRILKSSSPAQWQYVPTELNPADHGSRSVPAAFLGSTSWLTGPRFLHNSQFQSESQESFELVDPALDSEIRPQVCTNLTEVPKSTWNSERFSRFSNFNTLIRAIARLIHIASSFSKHSKDDSCRGWHICCKGPTEEELEKARILVLKSAQYESYPTEIQRIVATHNLPRKSVLRKLSPVLDNNGLLRVGGRIVRSDLGTCEVNPIIIQGTHHVATLIVRHYHEAVKHQGRHFTEGAVRAAGYWLVGGKRCIRSLLFKCVTCKRLRGKTGHQQMSDLPVERLTIAPPFTYVGVDVFGPWEVTARKTRGGQANSKRWAVMFSCMCTRAVHIEVIEAMSSSSFINALRRFFAIRGPVKHLYSDRGTNFVGASRELRMDTSCVNSENVQKYLKEQHCTWIFNPPHASHMGGHWERMIGIARRILDCMLLDERNSRLTHEVLTTFMAEITAVMNSRPLIPVSSDPEFPFILTPATLLTQKTGATPPPPGDFGNNELLREEWKQVQRLADIFWTRWKKEYLSTLQSRQKWQDKKSNLKEGDIVLVKNIQVNRNEWPMAIVEKTSPSKDGLVRKADIKVTKDGIQKILSRPVSELILLLSPDG